MSFLEEIKRRKVFKAAAVYAIVAWVLVQIVVTVEEPLNLPGWVDTFVILLVAIGFPITLVVSWVFDLTTKGLVRDEGNGTSRPSGGKSNLPADTPIAVVPVIPTPKISGWKKAARIGLGFVAVAILAVGLLLYSLYKDFTTTYSIAVLPFTNMSTDEETGFFARGLSENILDELAQRVETHSSLGRKLKVASRTSSFQLADKGVDLAVIADKLNVAYLLEGSVQPMGDSLHITAQLIRAEDNFHVWSKSYDRALADRFEIQAGVAQNVAHVAVSELYSDLQKRYVFWIARGVGTNSAAYGHLLDARNQFRLIGLGEGGDWALYEQFLKKAVEADPDYSEPYGFLAQIYLGRLGGTMSLQEARIAAHAAASKSLELNPKSNDGLLALGLIYLYMDLDYANAETILKQGPSHNFTWPHGLARIALREGRTKEALRFMATASELGANYLRGDFLNAYGWFLLVAGDYEQALKVTAEAVSMTESSSARAFTLRIQATALLGLGGVEKARPLLAEAWDLDGSLNPGAYISLFVGVGDKERAERILADLQNENKFIPAKGYLALGDIDNTFKGIEAAIEDYSAGMIDSLRTAEWWDPIRDDPRFDEMLKLLDSKETHTEQYLKDHSIKQPSDK